MTREPNPHWAESDLAAVERGGRLWIVGKADPVLGLHWCRSLADNEMEHPWYEYELEARDADQGEDELQAHSG